MSLVFGVQLIIVGLVYFVNVHWVASSQEVDIYIEVGLAVG